MGSGKYWVRNRGKPHVWVFYRIGQGIGLYSSWAMIALTNHCLVRYSAMTVGYKTFVDYLVLGDDIVIADEKVAGAYSDLIKSIGMEISIPKSVLPKGGLRGCEFASRLFVSGIEVGPLPVGQFLIKDKVLSLFRLWTSLLGRYITVPMSTQDLDGTTSPDLGASLPLRGGEGVQHTWALYFLYTNWYIRCKEIGEFVSPGPLSWLPIESSLWTLLEATPLEVFINVEKDIICSLQKKYIKSLTLTAKYAYDFRSVGTLIEKLILSVNPGWSRNPLFLRDLTMFFGSPWLRSLDRVEDFLRAWSGDGKLGIMTGSGVILRRHQEFLSDILIVITKAPAFAFRGLDEQDLIDFTRLSLGPKSLFLGKDSWMSKDPLIRIIPKDYNIQRVSKHRQVQGIRQSLLLSIMKWSRTKRKDT